MTKILEPAVYNLKLYRGDSYGLQVILWDDEEKTKPSDLTGVTPRSEIRDKPGGQRIYATLVCDVVLPNIIIVSLLADDSEAILAAKGAWDLRLDYADGRVRTIVAGSVAVRSDVTKRADPDARSHPTT